MTLLFSLTLFYYYLKSIATTFVSIYIKVSHTLKNALISDYQPIIFRIASVSFFAALVCVFSVGCQSAA